MKFFYKLMLLFFLGTTFLSFSQTLEGRILDKDTEQPLDGATVYLDGTTVMTITDANGNFKIASDSKGTLVVSYIGYLTLRLEDPFSHRKVKILLKKDLTELQEVTIGKSPFSRREMMEVFRDRFLGDSKSARSCEIQNENDIRLSFDVSTNTLNATAANPLKIRNSYLQYDINFDLNDFKVEYKSKSLDIHELTKSYFSGSTFYTDFSKGAKAEKRRSEIYRGSVAHFMKTLVDQSWKGQKFQLYAGPDKLNPDDYFKITDSLGVKKVTLIKEPEIAVHLKINETLPPTKENLTKETYLKKVQFTIFYDDFRQSYMRFINKSIFVDMNGNFSPIYGVFFDGDMGSLKAGDMLPTDYKPEIPK